ncbi:hypothetical protein BSKO_09897 [Bryopsis sp. KO-2023]|nr:hypothetical protein BSKO_09897 [Bryopsis sp. KO-2023]
MPSASASTSQFCSPPQCPPVLNHALPDKNAIGPIVPLYKIYRISYIVPDISYQPATHTSVHSVVTRESQKNEAVWVSRQPNTTNFFQDTQVNWYRWLKAHAVVWYATHTSLKGVLLPVTQKKGKMAAEKKELMKAMAVVEGLQNQMNEEGTKRQRMMAKLKKEQKKAKLMCEILKEQKALLIEENSSSGESSEFGDSDSQSRNGDLQDLEAGVRKLEQEIAERNAKLAELECMGEKFQADADLLKRTVNDAVQSLGEQGLETTQTRKEIESLRNAVEQSLNNFRSAEEEREIKWHHQQKASEHCVLKIIVLHPLLQELTSDLFPLPQVRDDFFLARLQDIETRAVTAERELLNVSGGVDWLDAQIGTARDTLLSAPKYNTGLSQSPSVHHRRNESSPKRCSACVNMETGPEATLLEGNSVNFPITTKEQSRADFRLSPQGGLPSPSRQDSPGGWSDVPHRFSRSPEPDSPDDVVPVSFRVPTHPKNSAGGTIQTGTTKDGESGQNDNVDGKVSTIEGGSGQLDTNKSDDIGPKDLIDNSSTLAKEDLVNKLEQFAQTLKNIEAQNDTRISCVEADWRARLSRVEAKLSDSLKAQDDTQRKMQSSEERVKDLEDVVKAKDEAIAQLSLLSLESRRSPDPCIQHLISDNASATLQATEALHALELENHDLR